MKESSTKTSIIEHDTDTTKLKQNAISATKLCSAVCDYDKRIAKFRINLHSM